MSVVETKSRSHDQVETKSSPQDDLPLGVIATVSLVFSIALAVRLWFCLLDGHQTIIYSCDAYEYMVCANSLREVLSQPLSIWPDVCLYLAGLLPADRVSHLHEAFEPIKGLATQAGPTFPTFIMLSHLVTGTPITPAYSYVPVTMYSIVSSLTCGLVAYLGSKCWSKNIGLAAGLMAAFYPGFIVNSCRLYSESYAAFWLTASLAVLFHMYFSGKWRLTGLLGVLLGIMQGTRSALVLVTGLSFGFLAFFRGGGRRKLATAMILTVSGLAFAVVPCMVLQKLALGKSSFVQDRVSHYNVWVGMDVDAQGFLSYPYPVFPDIEKKSIPELLWLRYEQSHSRFVKLLFDKPLRLFKFPWNDFKTPIGPFSTGNQVLIHQLILMLSAAGICSSFLVFSLKNKITVSRLFLFAILAFHSVYFLFITVPRYGLTAMPLVILFAGAGLCFLANKIKEQKSRTTALGILLSIPLVLMGSKADIIGCLSSLQAANPANIYFYLTLQSFFKLALIAIFFSLIFLTVKNDGRAGKITTIIFALATIPFVALPLRAHSRQLEWSTIVNANSGPVSQKIKLSRERESYLKGNQCYLLIDARGKEVNQNMNLKINGVEVEKALIPISPFTQNLDDLKGEGTKYYEFEFIVRATLNSCGGLNLDSRQWFILPVDRKIMASALQRENPALDVEINAKANKSIELYGSYSESNDHLWIPSIGQTSWEKCLYGVENEDGLNDPRFDQKVNVKTANSARDLSSSPGVQTGSYNIRLLLPHVKKINQFSQPVETSKELSASVFDATIDTTTGALPEFGDDTVWTITYDAELNSAFKENVDVPLNIVAAVKSKSGKILYVSPWVPSSVELAPGENRFSFSFPVKPSNFKEEMKSISVTILKGGVADSNQCFGVYYEPESRIAGMTKAEFENQASKKLRWKSTSLTIEELVQQPTWAGYEIF